jgi:Rhodanese-related sulfurtransferase
LWFKQHDPTINTVSVEQLQQWLEQSVPFVLIDVRNGFEYEAGNMGADLMPLDQIETYVDRIPRDQKVIIHCKGGARSERAVQLLQDKYGYKNLFNLKGGILAWKEKYQPELPVV